MSWFQLFLLLGIAGGCAFLLGLAVTAAYLLPRPRGFGFEVERDETE